MSTNDDGGSAFPFAFSETVAQGSIGMSLRDYFAAAALPACIAVAQSGEGPVTASDIAWEAYSLADALLEARKQ